MLDRYKRSLVVQFTVIILLILVVGQGILYTWLLLYQRSYLDESLRTEVRQIARHCAALASAPDTDQRAVVQALDIAVRTRGVLSIAVLDGQGRVLATQRASGKDEGTEVADGGHFRPLFSIPLRNTVRVPLQRGRDGTVEVVYSGEPVNEVMSRFLVIPPVMQAITFFVVISAIVLFFRKKVSSPVTSINAALTRITEGDLVAEVPDLEDSELGSIAVGARFLQEKLASTLSRLHSLSTDVANVLERLTGTFDAVRQASRAQAGAIDGVVEVIRKTNERQRQSADRSDHLAQLAAENAASLLEMRSVADEIAASTERLFRTSADAYGMISSLSESTDVIANSSEEVYGAMERTSASVEEINASLASVRENAHRSTELSSHVRELLTERGTLAVADAIEAMERISDEVRHFEAVVAELAERSKDIEKVLVVINEVNERTNLLSLNASILAAQAGEHGKGFAVVADEIRALSDGTASSAKDISSIVGTIRSQIKNAIEAIRSGVAKVEEGKTLILRSGEAMGETLETAQRSARMTVVVEKATVEQAEGLRQIRMAMENVRLMLEKMTKSTDVERTGTRRMFDSVSGVKEVAELVRKATSEHASGTLLITRNLETSRDMVSQLHLAAQEQLRANEEVSGAVEQIRSAGQLAMRDLEEMTRAFGTLKNEVDALQKEMASFRTHHT